jgi:hypothetical protein
VIERHWIRLKLYQWGRLCRAKGIGYPTMSSTQKALMGRGGVFREPELPPDLEEIEITISRSPPQHKLILVEHYTKDGGPRDHAARLSLSIDSYYRRKNLAERHVYSALQGASRIIHSGAG